MGALSRGGLPRTRRRTGASTLQVFRDRPGPGFSSTHSPRPRRESQPRTWASGRTWRRISGTRSRTWTRPARPASTLGSNISEPTTPLGPCSTTAACSPLRRAGSPTGDSSRQQRRRYSLRPCTQPIGRPPRRIFTAREWASHGGQGLDTPQTHRSAGRTASGRRSHRRSPSARTITALHPPQLADHRRSGAQAENGRGAIPIPS